MPDLPTARAFYHSYRDRGGDIDRELLFAAALFHALWYMWFHHVRARWRRIVAAVENESTLVNFVLDGGIGPKSGCRSVRCHRSSSVVRCAPGWRHAAAMSLRSLDAEAETSLVVKAPDLSYVCDVQSFRSARTRDVRWLDIEEDFGVLQHFHETRDPSPEPFSWADAVKWKESGFTDAGIIDGGVLVSRAAFWTYSEAAWELAGVFTVPTARGAGLSRSVCTFVTSAILEAGRLATCHTGAANFGMRRLAESLGYKLVS